jgi:hypothetical protein
MVVDLPRRDNPPHHGTFMLADTSKALERFKGYRHGPFQHRVVLPCRDYGNCIRNFFETRLWWIYENLTGDWCVRVRGAWEDKDATIHYGFAQVRDAVHFALRWRGE